MKILVTTDNHVGYNEQDAIRGDDAAKTFDEVLEIGKMNDVDIIIQAGDLFHINRPSKRSMYQVMKSLRRHCLGDKPVSVQVLNHGQLSLDGDFDHVNFEDPNFNVSIPVFGISGNHDDSGGTALLAPMDILSMSGLLNHFGMIPDNDNIVVHPILLQQGSTKVALYGMASVRDERLFRSFRAGNVRFLRPQEDTDSWFNILCVHQNHAAHSPTNHLPENFIPAFMDLVIWGHEHECKIEPVTNPVTGFKVIQPGSSVATSLSEGEMVPKQVAILHVEDKEMTVEPICLRTVRPFMMKTVTLANSCIPPSRESKQDVTTWMITEVDRLIAAANEDWLSRNSDADAAPLPLIRLRVDFSGGYDVENPTRFSNRFVGRVANANDVVQYMRQKATSASLTSSRVQNSSESIVKLSDPDKIELASLVHDFLKKQELGILPETGMDEAIGKFVDKDDKSALKSFVDTALADKIQELLGELRIGEVSETAERHQDVVNHEQNVIEKRNVRKKAMSMPVVTIEDDLEAERATERHAHALAMATLDSDIDMSAESSESEPVAIAKPVRATAKSQPKVTSGTRTRKKPNRSVPVRKPSKILEQGKLDSDDDFD